VNRAENQIVLLSNAPTRVSYRFTAPRFDYETWTNYNHDGVTGFEPPETDEQFFAGEGAPVFSFGGLGFDVSALFESLKQYLVAWLADNMNGIGEVFARVVSARERLCVDGECLTADDVRALKALALAGGATNEGRPTSPIEVVVNGNNPAEINVGDSYVDLGAVASSTNSALLALGVRAFYGEDEVTSPNIDTSVPGEHNIIYRVVDGEGAILAEMSRLVIVAAPAAESPTSDVGQAVEEPEPSGETATTTGWVTSDVTQPAADEPEAVEEPAPEPAPASEEPQQTESTDNIKIKEDVSDDPSSE